MKKRPEPARSTKKLFRGGTQRVVPPAETVARVRQLSPVMGITRVANVTGLDSIGVPVVMVCRPNARSLAVSQGKGLDLDAARASGLMESVELWHAERMPHPLKLATWNELRFSHRMVGVEGLPRLSAGSFHANHKLLWVEGTNLYDGAGTWVPYEMVHANYTLPLPTGSGSFVMSSNGLASGNHLLEAVSHGLCEVIERDATTLWVYSGERAQAGRRVDLATVDDPGCREVLARYDRAGVAVGVWETTSDVGVAAFLCVIVERDPDRLRLLYPTHGMGCHPVREVALLRALTEAAQSRLTFIAGSRDDSGRDKYKIARDAEVIERTRAEIARPGARSFRDAPTFVRETFEEDVAFLLERLRTVGVGEAVCVDLTRPELGIPVVRVIVPGLESVHEAPGYVPGPRARRAAEAAVRA
jgi:ribosomal protein S12 methylthiotransferase accessory factor